MMRSAAGKIAVCGVFAALAVVIMLFWGITGIGTFAGPFIASAVLVPILEEYGSAAALTVYAAIAILTLLISPDREMALFFLLFGWYPVGCRMIERLPGKLLRIAVQLAVYAAIITLLYGVLLRLLGIDPGFFEAAKWANRLMAVLGAACFLLLGRIYGKLALLWRLKWRSRLMK